MRAIDAMDAYVPPTDTPSHRLHRVAAADYPWINGPESGVEIPAARVDLPDGTHAFFGSLIKHNKTLLSIAKAVPEASSTSVHSALMQALPSVLRGERHSGVAKIENSSPDGPLLFGVSRNIAKLVRLIFAVEQAQDEPTTLLRIAISMPKKHDQVMSTLGMRAGRRSQR